MLELEVHFLLLAAESPTAEQPTSASGLDTREERERVCVWTQGRRESVCVDRKRLYGSKNMLTWLATRQNNADLGPHQRKYPAKPPQGEF